MANYERARADLENSRRQAALSARQSFLGVTNGMAQVRALEQAVTSSETALASNKLGYEVGVRINIDVLNAEAQLFSTRRDLAKARYDTIMNGLRLKASTGVLSEEDVVRINTLLTQAPGAMYKLPAKTSVGAAPAAPAQSGHGRRQTLAPAATPRS